MAISPLENHPLRLPDGTLPDIRSYPEGESWPVASHAHERARRILNESLIRLLEPESLVITEMAILRDPHNLRDFLMPDLLVALGAGQLDPVYGVLRRQYRLWDEARPPDLVIELASPSTVGRDNLGKKEDYAAMAVREYVQFDPLEESFSPGLRVYQLHGRRYQLRAAAADGSVPSMVLPEYEWVPVAERLRLRGRTSGQLVPTPEEDRQARLDAEARASHEEQARLVAEARASHEEQARLAAEARIAALEAQLDAARASGTTQEPDAKQRGS